MRSRLRHVQRDHVPAAALYGEHGLAEDAEGDEEISHWVAPWPALGFSRMLP